MEIVSEKKNGLLTLRLSGRLDAGWCGHVEKTLAASVREGEHHIHVDMAGVSYMSSAGLRVLLAFYKQLNAIKGRFGVIHASDPVRNILELAGLKVLIANPEETAETVEKHETVRTDAGEFSVFPLAENPDPMRVEIVGDVGMLSEGKGDVSQGKKMAFDRRTFALGIGALGGSYEECRPRFGELLAVAGAAACQPTDGSSRPDYILSEEALVPEGYLLLGLRGEGAFSTLIRFEASKEARVIGLGTLARMALDLSKADAVAVAGVAETAGLVGAALRQSPAMGDGARWDFPAIRDWLSFTSERACRDTTVLLVGVAARENSPLKSLLRPVCRESGLLGHFHAAAFPYRPLQKGRIALEESVRSLFEGHNLLTVLHLLADTCRPNGAGESEFHRGALWTALLSC